MAQQDNSETIKYIVYGVVGITAITLLYFGIIRPITNKFGLTSTKEEREGKRAEDKLSRRQVFSPDLYKKNKDKVSIGSGRANSLANDIYSGKSKYYNDNEGKAVGGIKSAGTKVNISYIAEVFQRNYNVDLHDFLSSNSYLETEHWNQIDDYISKINKW